MESAKKFTAFIGEHQVASGVLEEVLPKLKRRFDRDRGTPFLVFDDETGAQTDFNLSGTLGEVLAKASRGPVQKGPGRPKLGVTAGEITLLPRHWDWLEQQPNGASAAIRRLIDEERKRAPARSRRQQATHATGRFLSAAAGNYPGYEEASRSLYRGDQTSFTQLISAWPKDVRNYALQLSKDAF